jgi:hypothetical protein
MKRDFIDKMIASGDLTPEEQQQIRPEYIDGYDHGHLLAADTIKNREDYKVDKTLTRAVSDLMNSFAKTESGGPDREFIRGAVHGLCWALFDCPNGTDEALKAQAARRVGGTPTLKIS